MRDAPTSFVIAGLDPAIHPFENAFAQIDGCPDQVRA
jgi:hypothetical protein